MHKMLTILTTGLLVAAVAAAEPLTDADEIVARANLASYYAGGDGRAEVRMIITDAQDRRRKAG